MASAFPDGIGEHHTGAGHLDAHASPFSFILLGALMLTALLGLLGGQPSPKRRVASEAVALTVDTPHILRNGIFFETRILIEPKKPIADLVLAISPSLWKDMTINSMIPAASDEKSEGGMFAFSYGPAEPGKPIAIKIDGQINPPLFVGTKGMIAVRDGDNDLVAMPVTMQVRP